MTSLSTTQDEGIELASFGTGINAVIVGASGGLGGAFVDHLRSSDDVANVFQLARVALRSDQRSSSLQTVIALYVQIACQRGIHGHPVDRRQDRKWPFWTLNACLHEELCVVCMY